MADITAPLPGVTGFSERWNNYKAGVKNRLGQNTLETTSNLKSGYLANSKVGQFLQSEMLSQQPVKDLFQKGFGVTIEEKNINIDKLFKETGIKPSISGNDIRFDVKSGTKLNLNPTQEKLLQKFGMSEEAISGLKTNGTAIIEKGTKLKQLTTFGIKSGEGALSKTGALMAKGFKGIPVWAALLTAAFEVPKIVTAFKNGDGLAQIGKSTLTVGGSLGGMAAGAAIGQVLIPIPGVGAIIGGIVGAIAGESIASKLGNGLLGKSKEEEKQEAQAASTTVQVATTQSDATQVAVQDPLSSYMYDLSFMDPNYGKITNNANENKTTNNANGKTLDSIG
ncbi:MAG: hypothetical protein PHC34_06680 [Candidatus Gastranaerophilales bacterium]|nr:hypothetical protein [Candidatus Gastranaerophilales bacterium]